MFKRFVLVILGCALSVFGEVENSILPLMNQISLHDLNGKINNLQKEELHKALLQKDLSLRVMSFNMLFNVPWSEKELDRENRWMLRKFRLVEYLLWAKPDIIGSQELQKNQLDTLMRALKNDYGYYGIGIEDGKEKGDITAIFYRKERFELIEGRTYYFSETPCVVSSTPFGTKNTFTVCVFHDLLTHHLFQVVNTHLAFGNIERRFFESTLLKEYLQTQSPKMPLIVLGDFNTFPFRQDIPLPFYDGECIVSTIEQAGVKDSEKLALFGHFGPISTTNFNGLENKSFSSLGTPGVILDHIFVNDQLTVMCHGIDPATVDGYWPSDHFPVIADLLLHQ